jgi:hypothetical protein
MIDGDLFGWVSTYGVTAIIKAVGGKLRRLFGLIN